MRAALLSAALAATLTSCAWTPVVHRYPSGLMIVRLDPATVAQACPGKTWDDGRPRGGRTPAGCYDASADTIFVRNDCVGAQALPHELAHREGIAEPSKAGYDW